MRYCTSCGHGLNNEARFCSRCGKAQRIQTIEVEPKNTEDKNEMRVQPKAEEGYGALPKHYTNTKQRFLGCPPCLLMLAIFIFIILSAGLLYFNKAENGNLSFAHWQQNGSGNLNNIFNGSTNAIKPELKLVLKISPQNNQIQNQTLFLDKRNIGIYTYYPYHLGNWLNGDVAFSSDDTKVYLRIGDCIEIWNVKDKIKTKTIGLSYLGDSSSQGISLHHGGELISVSTGNTALINIETGEDLHYQLSSSASTFSNDGRLFAYGALDSLNIMKVTNRSIAKVTTNPNIDKDIRYEPADGSNIGQLLYSPNDKHLLVGFRYYEFPYLNNFHIKEPTTLFSEYFFDGKEKSLSKANFSPDSRILAFGYDGKIMLYNLETREMREFEGRPGTNICSVVFLPNGKYLVVGYDSGVIDLLDTVKYQTIYSKEGGFRSNLGVSPNGNYLAYISIENALQIWDCSSFQ